MADTAMSNSLLPPLTVGDVPASGARARAADRCPRATRRHAAPRRRPVPRAALMTARRIRQRRRGTTPVGLGPGRTAVRDAAPDGEPSPALGPATSAALARRRA